MALYNANQIYPDVAGAFNEGRVLAQRNILANREMADREAGTAQQAQNVQFNQAQVVRRNTQEDAAAQQGQIDARHKRAAVLAHQLGSIDTSTPGGLAQFNAFADQYASDPAIVSLGITRPQITPEAVQNIIRQSDTEAGQMPATTYKAPTAGPRGSLVQTSSTGESKQVVGPDNSQPAPRAERAPQLVNVTQPDGTVQPQWIYPGQPSGVPVGSPTTPASAGPGGGGREATMFNRVLMSASQATKTLENITKLPVSSSTGIFGGASAPTSLLGSAVSTLRNSMTSQEVQSYKPIIAGLTRSLAGIEAAGMMPSGTLTHQMDAVIFQEGDSQLTKLRKLAEARQIVEEGVKTYLDNPRVADGQKKQIQGFIDRMEKAIPFTQDDVTALESSKDPKLTIDSVVKSRLGNDVMAQADKIIGGG